MKNKSNEFKFRKWLKSLKDIQIVCLYCLLYEEMNNRGFIESSFKL